ncbi:HepT-like ribonuclease domain-containing protein [Mucilaginibacter arboris]|uniref:DUF86 domain-containing protein n=1 Tax=Mucilaginibacter arboris TaxID=2682090 RepID=A0A7K1SX17_9SPHI|nr:DUF86 domain-containing protein [Mucilaginibacter arboris]MVN21854.1 DUF86 domain-containing protein [Mucilaginibacter arboris]
MSKRNNQLLIEDILQSALKIQKYTASNTFETFKEDEIKVDAVLRNFEIIGEAANKLTEDFKSGYTDIDWYRIIGFRNRIVHEYFGIDLTTVWRIKETYLLLLIDQLSKIIED